MQLPLLIPVPKTLFRLFRSTNLTVMKKLLSGLRPSSISDKGFTLVEMLLAIAIAAVLIEAAVRISVSETRSSITAHLVQSLRGDADRIINLIRLDMAEADAVFADNSQDPKCTTTGTDTVVLKIRHPYLDASKARKFAVICYSEGVDSGLFRSGPPYVVPSDASINGTNFDGSNYLGSGYLDAAAAEQRQLVRPMTTLRPNGIGPTVGAGFDLLTFSIQLKTQNLVAGSVWNKTYVVSNVKASVAGRCVAPGATVSSTDQNTTTC